MSGDAGTSIFEDDGDGSIDIAAADSDDSSAGLFDTGLPDTGEYLLGEKGIPSYRLPPVLSAWKRAIDQSGENGIRDTLDRLDRIYAPHAVFKSAFAAQFITHSSPHFTGSIREAYQHLLIDQDEPSVVFKEQPNVQRLGGVFRPVACLTGTYEYRFEQPEEVSIFDSDDCATHNFSAIQVIYSVTTKGSAIVAHHETAIRCDRD